MSRAQPCFIHFFHSFKLHSFIHLSIQRSCIQFQNILKSNEWQLLPLNVTKVVVSSQLLDTITTKVTDVGLSLVTIVTLPPPRVTADAVPPPD